MQYVYSANLAVEAHMVAHMLEHEGIKAQVHGEYLQGAIGEIPPVGHIKVSVADEDYQRARLLIEKWEESQREGKPSSVPNRHSKSDVRPLKGIVIFVAGLAIGLGGAYFGQTRDVINTGIDRNGDGVLDNHYTYVDGLVREISEDRNLDGKPDITFKYDEHGLITTAFSDDDFNGVSEVTTNYKFGNPVQQDIDADKDGKPERRVFFDNGVSTKIYMYHPDTLATVKIEHYVANDLKWSEYDSDGDGTLDTKYEYNEFNEIKSQSKLSPSP
jgi:antitoxin component YwqK of YwqJK toxin-antitoxin module